MLRMQKVIAIVGPTAVGKTALGVALGKALGGEVVSADSRQVYKGLDIGTGKATTEEMQGVPHHLLDTANPNDVFTAAEYVRQGRAAISEISARGHIPIIVGGTGFYIDALFGSVLLPDVSPNPELRKNLAKKKIQELMHMLEELDPKRAESIDANNGARIIRAIEIATALGKVPLLETEPLYNVLYIGLTIPADELKKRIHDRLVARLDAGMLEEAKKLHTPPPAGGGLSYERMEELGLEYRYMAWHLQDLLTLDEMQTELESEIKKYAKRQMTWFKRNKGIRWFSPNGLPEALALAKKFLSD